MLSRLFYDYACCSIDNSKKKRKKEAPEEEPDPETRTLSVHYVHINAANDVISEESEAVQASLSRVSADRTISWKFDSSQPVPAS